MTYQLLWQPDPVKAKQSQMFGFMQHVNKKFGKTFQDYHELHQWSIEHPADFWGTFWHYSGIIFSKDYEQVVDDPKKMPGAMWFQGARMNFAENLLKYRDERTAIIFRGETPPQPLPNWGGARGEVGFALIGILSLAARGLTNLGSA